MEPKVNYTVVGIFVVVLLIALSFLIVSLIGGHTSRHYIRYTLYVKESVSGLSEQSSVKYNGVEIGQVELITLNTKQPEKVKILLKIDERYPLHQGTTATLEAQGITGLSYIGLSSSKPNTPLLKPLAGQRYAHIPSKPSLLSNLNQTMHHVTTKIDTITNSIQSLLSEHNQAQIKVILDNIAALTTTLKNNDKHISSLLGNADLTMENVAKTSKDFPALSQQVKDNLTKFYSVLTKSEETLGHANKTLAKGGSLIDNANRQIIPRLYDNLNNFVDMSDSLKSLSRELKANPAIIIRGKKKQALGPGE